MSRPTLYGSKLVISRKDHRCRDLNAAINILGQDLSDVKPMEIKALAVSNNSETIVYAAGSTQKQVTGDEGAHYNFL